MRLLRPHQEEAVNAVERILPCLSVPSIVLQACTGAGKTEMINALRPDIVVAPGIDLVRQLRGRVESAEVYTIQGLSAALDRGEALPRAKRIAFDEGRSIAAPKWCRVPETYLRMGAQLIIPDATPATAKGSGLGQWASAIYQSVSMSSLIAQGYLVPFRVITSEGVGERPVDAWLRHLNGRRSLVFCRDKAHAAAVVAEFNAAGVPADIISDSTPEKRRRELLGWVDDDGNWNQGELATGKLWVLVCAQILRQGIDIPEVEGIVINRRCDSYQLFQQAVGRGGRTCDRIGKKDCIVVDMVGELTDKHGLPTDHKIWTLGEDAIRDPECLPPPLPCPTVGCRTYGRGSTCQFCGAPLPAPGSTEAKRETLRKIIRSLLSEGAHPWDAKHRYRRAYGLNPPAEWILGELHDYKIQPPLGPLPLPIAPPMSEASNPRNEAP